MDGYAMHPTRPLPNHITFQLLFVLMASCDNVMSYQIKKSALGYIYIYNTSKKIYI